MNGRSQTFTTCPWRAASSARQREGAGRFELFVRRLRQPELVIAAGLQQAVEFCSTFGSRRRDPLSARPAAVRKRNSRFLRSAEAVPLLGRILRRREGTSVFAGDPLIMVRAPLAEAQDPRTYLLSLIGIQT